MFDQQYTCGTCGRAFVIQTRLEDHNGQHKAEEFRRLLKVQQQLDNEWFKQHPSWLAQVWARFIAWTRTYITKENE